jgi:catechol 2,3-dioxygenase-like lactoylglutathione lyase family enzyme
MRAGAPSVLRVAAALGWAGAEWQRPGMGSIMFDNLMATAVLPASDLDRARTWWHDVLGREPVYADDEPGNLLYDVGGTIVLVYRTDFAGTAQNTALDLVTDDIDRDATALRTHGVVFHEYDLPGLKTVDGIADIGGLRGAWFSDSEGNIIAISQPTPEMMQATKGMRAGTAN